MCVGVCLCARVFVCVLLWARVRAYVFLLGKVSDRNFLFPTGLDLLREFLGGGLDGWFRTVIPPGDFDSHRELDHSDGHGISLASLS